MRFIGIAIFIVQMYKTIIILMFSAFVSESWALNSLRELEYAEQIALSNPIGKIVKLQVDQKEFLGLYLETEKKANLGTAIIIHSQGGHPNQNQIIQPLRTYLPDHNWATLSIQMPVLGSYAQDYEYFLFFDQAKDRIQAAVDYLTSAGVKNITLIGYGLGGMMSVYYLSQNLTKFEVKAIVTISMSVPESTRKEAQILKFMGQINQPFLDVVVEFDLPGMTNNARKKRMAGKSNKLYRQLELKSHLFQHDEGLIVKRIYSWINRTFKTLEQD